MFKRQSHIVSFIVESFEPVTYISHLLVTATELIKILFYIHRFRKI
jgi:hypothetical protein